MFQWGTRLVAQAVEAEVADFLGTHAEMKTADGHRRVVRHGHLPEREVMTGRRSEVGNWLSGKRTTVIHWPSSRHNCSKAVGGAPALMTNELHYRVKNTLAVVLSGQRTAAEARDVLLERVHALGRVQELSR